MFKCEICGYEFENEEMSDDHNVCHACYDDERDTELIALDII